MNQINDYTDTKLIQPIKKYAFVFVCQKGKLEIEALFLAASLNNFLKCDFELIAAIPQPEVFFDKPSDLTLKLLKKMGVRIEKITNELVIKALENNPNIDFSKSKNQSLLYANKIFCLKVPTSADKLIFLDSDMLLYKDFCGDICFSIPFNAQFDGFGSAVQMDGKWKQLFDLVDADLPPIRHKFINYKGNKSEFIYAPPYFNAGFIGVNSIYVDSLFDEWLYSYKKILASNILDRPLFSEQYALTIAVHKIKIPYNLLKNDFKSYAFFHYFNMDLIKNNPIILNLIQSMIQKYPELKELIQNKKEWEFLFEKNKTNFIKFLLSHYLPKSLKHLCHRN